MPSDTRKYKQSNITEHIKQYTFKPKLNQISEELAKNRKVSNKPDISRLKSAEATRSNKVLVLNEPSVELEKLDVKEVLSSHRLQQPKIIEKHINFDKRYEKKHDSRQI